MIIVSQNKLGTTECLTLDIAKNPVTDKYMVLDKYARILGEYSSKEKAKEILKEIYNFYEVAKRYECSSNNGLVIFLDDKFVYEMPEE